MRMFKYLIPVIGLTACAGAHSAAGPKAESWHASMEFDAGVVEFTLDPAYPAAIHPLHELVNKGYYNGHFIAQATPGYFVTVGEPVFSPSNTPVQALALSPQQTKKWRGNRWWEIGLLDHGNGQYGPQLVITQGGLLNANAPKSLHMGSVSKGKDVLARLRKGDYLRRFTLRIPHHQ